MANEITSENTCYNELQQECVPELTDDNTVPITIEKKKRKSPSVPQTEAQKKALEMGRQKLAVKRAVQREEKNIREDPMLKSMRKLLEESAKTIRDQNKRITSLAVEQEKEMLDNKIEKPKPQPQPVIETPQPQPQPQPLKPRNVFI